ncbi:MAG: hypothetical protein LBU34_07260 [Planctomycetaceae bacterium]|jgi:hypothetical protein|nr:hypothetical protein [Planctomycetaceae bacterium]
MTQQNQTQNQQTENTSKPKKKRIFSRFIFVFMFLLVLLTIYCICIHVPPLVVSEKTTRITKPLTEDGQVDFLRYLEEAYYPKELATDENGFRLFIQKFGYIFSEDNFHKQQMSSKLGLGANIKPAMTLPENPRKTYLDYQINVLHDLKLSKLSIDDRLKIVPVFSCQPWTLEEFPMLTDWITKIDEPLDAIAEMIHKPVFFVPYIPNEHSYKTNQPQSAFDLLLLRYHALFCGIADQYVVRTYYRIGKGDIDGAVDDIVTIYKLARHLRRINGNIYLGIEIEEKASHIPIDNPKYPVTQKQLQHLFDTINQLPNPSITDIIEWERIRTLSVVQNWFNNNMPLAYSDSAIQHIYRRSFFIYPQSVNPNIVFRRINDYFDNFIGTESHKEITYSYKSSVTNSFLHLLTVDGRAQVYADMFMNNMFTDVMSTGFIPKKAFQCADCALNMKRLSLALLMYKSEHGELPKTDWIEKIKPYFGDDFEQYLCCSACSCCEKGKTNYALILYDKKPLDKYVFQDVLQLLELRNSVPYEQAVMTVDEVLQEVSENNGRRIGDLHVDDFINISKQNGSVQFSFEKDKIKRLLGQDIENNPDN